MKADACRAPRASRWGGILSESRRPRPGLESKGRRIILAAILTLMLTGSLSASLGRAQSSPPVVGVLTPGLAYDPVLEGLRQGLLKLGYRGGREIKLLVEDCKGDVACFEPRATKLVEAKPNVIFAVATATSMAVHKTARSIPIVFSVVGDPIQAGLVASFASSGNNVTGVASSNAPLSGKRLELLLEIAPKSKKILALVSVKENTSEVSFKYLAETARTLGVQVWRRDVVDRSDVEKVLLEKWAGTADAVYHVPSVLVSAQIEALIAKARRERLPLMVYEDSQVDKGAPVSYGGDFRSFGVQAAKIVVKILRGTKPADIPVETPDRLLLAVNAGTAKTIGLKIPDTILERADKVVE